MKKEDIKNLSDQEIENEIETLKSPLERILDRDIRRRELEDEKRDRIRNELNQ